MPATLEQTGPNVVTRRSVFILRFISTVALWSVALLIMFSGYEILFWVLISVFGMIGLWEFYRMLDHKGLPNFKITGMICGAVMLAGFLLLGALPNETASIRLAGLSVLWWYGGVLAPVMGALVAIRWLADPLPTPPRGE